MCLDMCEASLNLPKVILKSGHGHMILQMPPRIRERAKRARPPEARGDRNPGTRQETATKLSGLAGRELQSGAIELRDATAAAQKITRCTDASDLIVVSSLQTGFASSVCLFLHYERKGS